MVDRRTGYAPWMVPPRFLMGPCGRGILDPVQEKTRVATGSPIRNYRSREGAGDNSDMEPGPIFNRPDQGMGIHHNRPDQGMAKSQVEPVDRHDRSRRMTGSQAQLGQAKPKGHARTEVVRVEVSMAASLPVPPRQSSQPTTPVSRSLMPDAGLTDCLRTEITAASLPHRIVTGMRNLSPSPDHPAGRGICMREAKSKPPGDVAVASRDGGQPGSAMSPPPPRGVRRWRKWLTGLVGVIAVAGLAGSFWVKARATTESSNRHHGNRTESHRRATASVQLGVTLDVPAAVSPSTRRKLPKPSRTSHPKKSLPRARQGP